MKIFKKKGFVFSFNLLFFLFVCYWFVLLLFNEFSVFIVLGILVVGIIVGGVKRIIGFIILFIFFVV